MSALGRIGLRTILLGVAVLLEGVAVVSVVLRVGVLPVAFYGNIVSVAVFVLPTLVGLLSQRIEAALLLAVLPFYALAVVYLAVYAQPWNTDLFSFGVTVQRAAGVSVLLLVLALIGWLLRRVLPGVKTQAP